MASTTFNMSPAPAKAKLDTRELSTATRHGPDTPSHVLSSAPPTPNFRAHAPLMRRPSQPATSPILPTASSSPRPSPHAPLRRASSSASVSRPPPASPRLAKKSSRASLGEVSTDSERRLTPKRSISNLISGLREAQTTMESIEEPIPLTAAQIATEHFTRELISHSSEDFEAETVVILHDACYGHRYSRLKTTKAMLSLIVERPERIHASILGASTAYVRLGGHHASGRHAPHPERIAVSCPPFKIRRSIRSMDVTSPYVTNVHGTGWMSELQRMCHAAPDKLAAGAKELGRSSLPGEPEKDKLHEGDLYLAPESLDAFQGALGGVADAVDAVFATNSKTSRAFVAVRPPGHHCSAAHPSGFCWLNNVHVGIEYAALTYGLTHAAILDIDLHHGDGSQAITWERNSKNNIKRLNAKPNSKLKLSPDIGYYSLHDINSYPCEMGDDEKVQAASLCIENAHGQSIWNVHLQPWKNLDEFWRLYEERYRILLDKARHFLEYHATRIKLEGKVRPQAAIFISAGFDASEWEGAGMQRHKVNVPTEFYARFTQDVVKLAQAIDGCDGRVISVLEGGYSDRALCSGVLSHLSGLCCSSMTSETNGVDALMEQMNTLSMNGADVNAPLRYEQDWWSDANLTALENKVNPPPPPQAKKIRTGPQPTYATPTESFAYKVVDTQKFARSISGTMREATMPSRPPTPPPPEVDWVVATQQLSNLLIPTNRQTKSCTADDLAVPRSKDKAVGQPSLPTDTGPSRQLRDRRAKGPVYADSAHSDELESVRSTAASRAQSQASRRETIDILPVDQKEPAPQRRVSRRLSAGSTLSSTASGSIDANAPPMPTLPINGTMKPPPAATHSALPIKKARAPTKPPLTKTLPGSLAKPASADQPSGIENMTSGMKKIILKVSGTKEEHDRKLKEKLDADRRARALKAAETRRVNAAAKKAAAERPTPTPMLAAPADPIVPVMATKAVLPVDAAVVPELTLATQTMDTDPPTITSSNWGAPVMGKLKQEFEVPASFHHTPVEELHFPTYTNGDENKSGSPARPSSSRALPVWSSTGPIPFSAGQANGGDYLQKNDDNPGVWDVPDSHATHQ